MVLGVDKKLHAVSIEPNTNISATQRTRSQLGGGHLPAHRACAQAPLLRLLLRLGALDAPPLPLRPGDEARLDGLL